MTGNQCSISKLLHTLLGVVILVLVSSIASADLVRGLENYLKILKSEKDMKNLSAIEANEVLEIHNRLQGFSAAAGTVGSGCKPVIETQISGSFNGWDGETVFKLMNGQIWQQISYAYHYHYAYMPGVLIYPSGSGCTMKVEGVDDTISVRRLR